MDDKEGVLRIDLHLLPENVTVSAASVTTTCVASSCELDVPYSALTANKKIAVSVALRGKSPSTKEFERPGAQIQVDLVGGLPPARDVKTLDCELGLTGSGVALEKNPLPAHLDLEADGTIVLLVRGGAKFELAGQAIPGLPKTPPTRLAAPQQLPFLRVDDKAKFQVALPVKASSPDNSAEGALRCDASHLVPAVLTALQAGRVPWKTTGAAKGVVVLDPERPRTVGERADVPTAQFIAVVSSTRGKSDECKYTGATLDRVKYDQRIDVFDNRTGAAVGTKTFVDEAPFPECERTERFEMSEGGRERRILPSAAEQDAWLSETVRASR